MMMRGPAAPDSPALVAEFINCRGSAESLGTRSTFYSGSRTRESGLIMALAAIYRNVHPPVCQAARRTLGRDWIPTDLRLLFSYDLPMFLPTVNSVSSPSLSWLLRVVLTHKPLCAYATHHFPGQHPNQTITTNSALPSLSQSRRQITMSPPTSWVYNPGVPSDNPHKYKQGGFHPLTLHEHLKDGCYEIWHRLGTGGFATVWLARDTQYACLS